MELESVKVYLASMQGDESGEDEPDDEENEDDFT